MKAALSLSTRCLMLLALLGGVASQPAHAGLATPLFSKSFSPSIIGPGSVSTLTFTITNLTGALVTDLAFSDTLPAGVVIADPANASTTCTLATLSAPGGGSTISLSGGGLPDSASCFVLVDVTSSTVGVHMNISGDLTSSVGNSGPASADLEVSASLIGFSKSFSPSAIEVGQVSTLSFVLDNSLSASNALSLSFSDVLPGGVEVAFPANVGGDCTGVFAPNPGDTSLLYLGSLSAGASCTLSVDVLATTAGSKVNVSSDLVNLGVSSGRASAVLNVVVLPRFLSKSFIDDPVSPGTTVTLELVLTNFDRIETATDIAFTDDLNAVVPGLSAVGLPLNDVCGPGSQLSGTTTLTFTGGTLGPEQSCTLTVTLQVPAAATAGTFTNTTSSVTLTLGGSPVVDPAASDDLVIVPAPVLTKTVAGPAKGGDTISLDFQITNPSAMAASTSITFTDPLTTFLPGVSINTLPASGFCGAGSTIIAPIISGELTLIVSGASLAAGGSCSFSVLLDLPANMPTGTYTNLTSAVEGVVGGVSYTGRPATASLQVLGGPLFSKSFTDDPVLAGATVTLEFTLEVPIEAPFPATGISFTDDLNAALAGLTAVGLPALDICGMGSQINGTTVLTFTGGTLNPGESCTFPVTLTVPAGASPGLHTNTTSQVSATMAGLAVTNNPAQDALEVLGLLVTKTFVNDPVVAGGTLTLHFDIANTSPVTSLTDIFFLDDLNAALSGLTAVGLPVNDVCGAGSQISGTSPLSLTGGTLGPAATCGFDVTLQIPAAAAPGEYINTTSTVSALADGNPIVVPPASDSFLVIDALSITKSFIDDPVAPGGTVTLRFTLSNQDPATGITGITFTDDLSAALPGLAAVGLPVNDVCGAGSQISGTSLLTLTGGNIAPAGSCTFDVTLQVPAAVPQGTTAINTTSTVSGTLGATAVTGAPASDTLLLTFVLLTKSFDGPTILGGAPVLTLTLENLSDSPVAGLALTDNLDAVVPGLVAAGLPQVDVCGTGSLLAGTSLLTLAGASLPAAGSCSMNISLQVPAMAATGSFLNTTSEVSAQGLVVGVAASANLVIDPPPGFAKSFAPNPLFAGDPSTLSFTIDNTASTSAATNLSFSDALPAGVVVASPANASTTCTGGMITAVSGTGTVTYVGGTVAAGASCLVQVNVTSAVQGSFVNVSGGLSSSLGLSGTATDTLVVVPGLVLSKAFLSAPVLRGGAVDLQFMVQNPSSVLDATGASFTDDLGAVLPGLSAVGLPMANVCGAGSQISGTTVLTLTGGNLPAGGSCTFTVSVVVPAAAPLGILTNTTSVITATLGGAATTGAPASADLEVGFLTISKAFAGTGAPGGTILLTFILSNPDPINGASGIGFTDNLDAVLPGLVAIGLPQADPCGAGSQLSGTSVLTLTGGTLAPGGSCTFGVTLQIPGTAAQGLFTNLTSIVSAIVGGTPVAGDAAGAAQASFPVEGIAAPEIPTLAPALLLLLGGVLGLLALGALRRLR